jgi:putative DNA primase/helicase
MKSTFPPRNLVRIFNEVRAEYGEPHFPRRNSPGTLNEPFWAAIYRRERDILFEPREGSFWEFAGDIYRMITSHIILDRLAQRLREVASSSPYVRLNELTSAKHLAGVIAHLKGQVQKEEAFANPSGLIFVANGVLDLSNGGINLLPFSPQLISRTIVPIDYKPGAKCPRFQNDLLGLLDQDDRELLQKFLGLFLLGRNVIQKLLILHGLGETGKSTFSEIARKLIGVTNCAELRTNLLGERFEIGSFIGKHLLIGADVSSSFLHSRGAYRLKAIVGGDLLDAERKGSNYRFQLPGNFNVLITSNSRLTTHLENDRGPWARRLAIVEYERPRTCKIIPEFAEVLIREEGSGILTFGVEGLIKLRDDISAYGSLQLSKRQRERIDSLLNESDALRLFLENYVEPEHGSSLTSDELVQGYSQYCLQKGWNMSIRETQQELPDLMMELFQVARSHNVPSPGSKSGVRGYRGVKWI